MRDPYGDPGDDVAQQLLGPVRPEPVQDGKVDEQEVTPLFERERREEGITVYGIEWLSKIAIQD